MQREVKLFYAHSAVIIPKYCAAYLISYVITNNIYLTQDRYVRVDTLQKLPKPTAIRVINGMYSIHLCLFLR